MNLKFVFQGCHILLKCNCPNSIPAQDDGEIASLEHHTIGIHGEFSQPCSIFVGTVEGGNEGGNNIVRGGESERGRWSEGGGRDSWIGREQREQINFMSVNRK